MRISKLIIKGFRSFGPEGASMEVDNDLSAFIGLNSSGKTTALDALRKLFGSSTSEREILRQDFHMGKEEDPEKVQERSLSIEVQLSFSADDKEEETVPHYFDQMVIEKEGEKPYVRLRLEANWKHSARVQDGEIDTALFVIHKPDGEPEDEEDKYRYPNHLRSLIEILYVPAIRRPAEQIRFVSGTILYRVLSRIKWTDDFKEAFEDKIDLINDAFRALPEFETIQSSIGEFWKQFHKDERYKDANLGFGGSDFESVLRKFEVSFSPTGTYRSFGVNDLGEGYRSMFYLTLVCALLDVEEKLVENDGTIGIHSPLLTILAIEEPENHIAPQLLGRIIRILKTISEKEASQVLISSHTPTIIQRLDPEMIFHFRITEEHQSQVNRILMPEAESDAYKYVKEAIRNFPELYFARLVVIGEGDSEKVIFNRLMKVMDTDFDDNIITFAPLGHRFVNHIWKLLEALHIPYITLLDLDLEREGGGWGRIKYVLIQLLNNGADRNKLLKLSDDSILTDQRLEGMHKWKLTNKKISNGWVSRLKNYDVFYSSPLDLDFVMLQHYKNHYYSEIPDGGGPRIPDKAENNDKFQEKVKTAVQATLKSEKANGDHYSEEEKELMIWYNYHFLGRGKPSTHITVLSKMSDEEIKANLPPVFTSIFERIAKKLKE